MPYSNLLSKKYKEILQENENYIHTINILENISVYNTSGVQGIVGKIINPNNKQEIILKISKDTSFFLENEYVVGTELKSLCSYLPHYLYTYGMKTFKLHIDNNIIKNNENGITRDVLFLNKIYNYSLYEYIKFVNSKNNVIGMMLQIIMALYVAQKQINFTHYDLHVDNILIQECDKTDIFIYKIDDNYYWVNTCGFFPVLIDYGLSYSNKVNQTNITSSLTNYQNGFQTLSFNPLKDIHQICLTTFYSLSKKNKMYCDIFNKIKKEFEPYNLEDSGWINLPVDIINNIRDLINIEDEFFDSKWVDIIDFMARMVKMPLRDGNRLDSIKTLNSSFEIIMDIFHKIFNNNQKSLSKQNLNIKSLKPTDAKLLIMRNVIKYCSQGDFTQEKLKNIFLDITNKEMSGEYNCDKLLKNSVIFGNSLSVLIKIYITQNNKYLDKLYQKTKIKTAIDMFNFLSKMYSQSSEAVNGANVYLFNTDTKKQKRFQINLDKEQLKDVNLSPNKLKSYKLLKYIREQKR